jgi:general secretion pathway protein I
MTTPRRAAGFTLLEVLVATVIMAIAVSGLLSAISTSLNNASRLTGYDRSALLAKRKLDELLLDTRLPRNVPIEGVWTEAEAGGTGGGWTATVTVFDMLPGSGPGASALERIELEVWWAGGDRRRSLRLEGFRRGILRPGDTPALGAAQP